MKNKIIKIKVNNPYYLRNIHSVNEVIKGVSEELKQKISSFVHSDNIGTKKEREDCECHIDDLNHFYAMQCLLDYEEENCEKLQEELSFLIRFMSEKKIETFEY